MIGPIRLRQVDVPQMSLNRMNDMIDGCRVDGSIVLDGEETSMPDKSIDVVMLRARVGMVFQKPNPFPKSIYRQRGLWAPHP